MKRDVDLGVESDVVPLSDNPHVPVVCILPARQLPPFLLLAVEAGAVEQHPGEVAGHGYALEDVEKVPVDDRMKVGEGGIIEAGVALLVQEVLQLLPQHQGGDVGDVDGEVLPWGVVVAPLKTFVLRMLPVVIYLEVKVKLRL